MKRLLSALSFFFIITIFAAPSIAQIQEAPERGRGEGPYERLIIRGVILVDGTGSPPMGAND